MSSVVISGDVSGSVTLQAPSTAGSTVLTLPATSGTVLTTASGQWITSGSNIYYNTGNVGIGTTNPVYKTVISNSGAEGIELGPGYSAGRNLFQSYNRTTSAYVQADYVASVHAWQTSATERMRIDSNGYITNGANGNSAGLVQGYQYYRLNSGYVGSNATGAQSIFGVGVTLVGSTVYEFEMVVSFTKTAGTTSHTLGFGFGGTATLNNIYYQAIGGDNNSGLIMIPGATVLTWGASQSASNTVFTRAITSASEFITAIIKGTVSVNAGGTFIPQYTLSAAPGGAYTTQIGSYIKIAPLSASGSNTSIGTWA